MQAERESKKDFFEEYGLEVVQGDVKIGETYPLFGMITKFVAEAKDRLTVEINFGITAHVQIEDQERVNLLRERAFESGIFVSKVINKEPQIEVNVQTIIFGRKQGYQA